jgi:hypothetical protein
MLIMLIVLTLQAGMPGTHSIAMMMRRTSGDDIVTVLTVSEP